MEAELKVVVMRRELSLLHTVYFAAMSLFNSILNFLHHRLHAHRWDSFHSPYLFNLFTFCCDDRNYFPEFGIIENKRKDLIHLKDKIKRIDFGAGPAITASSSEKPLSFIASHGLSLPFQCRFLYRLMKMTKPNTIIEFGTSLGIATSYLATGSMESQVITVEGDPALASIAQKVFEEKGIKNIRLFNSTFEDFLKQELKEIKSIDFVFLDGNHKAEPLLFYYHSLQPLFNSNTIVMVDDIYWSKDMHEGWTILIEMPEVTQSVDCFQFGLLFFRPDFMNKETHLIRLPLKAFKPAK